MNGMDQILMREHHLENETLSLKAEGLFFIMLLQEPTWNFTVCNLPELSRDGIEAVGNAVCELEKAGYVERHREYSPKGHISGVRYILHRTPCQGKPAPENHQPEN